MYKRQEQRDSAKIVEEDTYNFSRINHEVGFGEPYSKEETSIDYQEDGGIPIVKKLKKSESKVLKERR